MHFSWVRTVRAVRTGLLVFAFSTFACFLPAQGPGSTSTAKVSRRTAARRKEPSTADQLNELREQLAEQARQIESLKSGMAQKDAQLERAEQAAAEAKAAATRAEAAAQEQQQVRAANSQAVTSLQTAVDTVKSDETVLSTTVKDEVAKVKQAVESPSVLHYKGITLTPTGFVNGESVYRSHATGGGLTTAFSSIPYEKSDGYRMSEFTISGNQSRIGMNIETKIALGTIRAYFEGDFLGVGTTSNGNQSNSYLYRQRILLAELETANRWTFSGGQGWSLAAENKKGISTAAGNIALPQQIDPNYLAGLVWARGGSLRVTKNFGKAAFAIAAENPQILYSASLAGSTPYAVMGSAGNGGGLMNGAVSSCAVSTVVANYTNQREVDSAGNVVDVAVPVYKTLSSCAQMANISFNQAPDMIVKTVFDPSFGHFEVFGIARFAHETVYPGETTNSYLYGGTKDIATGVAVAPALSSTGAFNNNVVLGGVGASARWYAIPNRLTLGLKGLYGAGVGKYGDSTLPDVTANAAGAFAPIHNLSGLVTVEYQATPRLALYTYYGGDYASRADYGGSATTSLGTPTAMFCVTGTTTCTASPTAAEIAQGGSWGAHWATPSPAAVGYGSRLYSDAACANMPNPGYTGSSAGYYAGSSCGANTRDVQEATLGYWYDLYKGEHGRLRQGIQYSYATRIGWSGVTGLGAKGLENMLFTSFRYYIP